MAIAANSPAGSCVRAEVEGLLRHYDVTVFTERCDLGDLPGLEVQAVRAPDRPVVLRYLAFHLAMPWHHAAWRRRGGRAALVQTTQGQLPGADIAYAHFCHAGYLAGQWRLSTARGLRRLARWLTHQLNAWFESRSFARARLIVAPSQGLRLELLQQYPQHAHKVHVLANPVDVAHFARPDGHDARALRRELGLADEHLVLGFMALGDFSRKGLGLLIEALSDLHADARTALRMLVIGGRPGEIAEFQALATRHGVSDHLVFAGMQRDVRPYLWCCDVFAFPSSYEIFSLAILQAAAAGLPVLVSQGLYGAEEFVVDEVNGWVVARDRASLRDWYQRLLRTGPRLGDMGAAARQAVQAYDAETFRERWLALVDGLVGREAP
jgi:glycosyltransferase involved in cell wall biosynthesis